MTMERDAMDSSAVREVVEQALAEHGLELDDLSVVAAGSRRLVRVTVDGDGASGRGPTLDEIADASRDLSVALDTADVMGDRPYVLEVSSRGVDRPLTKPAHWRRNIGRLVTVTRPDADALTGRILAAGPDTATVATETTTYDLPFSTVTKAVVQVELNRPSNEEDGDSDALGLDHEFDGGDDPAGDEASEDSPAAADGAATPDVPTASPEPETAMSPAPGELKEKI